MTQKTFNTTQLSDENFNKLINAGFTINEIERFTNQLEYRREYNSRPDVKEKRKLYTAKRNLRLSLLAKILKGGN